MSKFIKKLGDVAKGKSRAIGFGAAKSEKASQMLMIASLSTIEDDLIKTAAGEVDALLFDIKDPVGQAFTMGKSVKNSVPWGVRLNKIDDEGIKKLIKAECDFIVLKPDAAAHLLQHEILGKVLEIDISLENAMVQVISRLSVDAVLLEEGKHSGSLTIDQLMNYHRISSFGSKVPLAFSPQEISDFEVLHDAGIKGVIIELSGKDAQAKLTEAKEAIAKLPTEKRKKPKSENQPLLPSAIGTSDENCNGC